ncbi:MAG TPA: sialidase family protein [Rhodanobacteraceae bacterium]|nr:sialidase family protein [Rhodanobacteraceae bacterium]
MHDRLSAAALAAFLCCAPLARAQQHVTTGPEYDDQPSVIQSTDDGARIVVFERLDSNTLDGDLWLTRSTDGGASWTDPVAIIATVANERHPALVQTGPAQYALFYLKGTGAITNYRIYRATSSDGVTFTEQNQVDFGWATGGDVNPHVVRHDDGTLTMSYQRFSGGTNYDCFVAESTDGGLTWDPMQTMIATGAQVPRITYRESDGVYLASYQVGGGNFHIYTKTTTNVRDWSGARVNFAVVDDNEDSLPVVMPDGAFVTFYIHTTGGTYDIAYRRSTDGTNWAPAVPVTNTLTIDDIQPHPLLVGSPDYVELYWGQDDPAGSLTYDIVREPIVPVNDIILADGFDG